MPPPKGLPRALASDHRAARFRPDLNVHSDDDPGPVAVVEAGVQLPFVERDPTAFLPCCGLFGAADAAGPRDVDAEMESEEYGVHSQVGMGKNPAARLQNGDDGGVDLESGEMGLEEGHGVRQLPPRDLDHLGTAPAVEGELLPPSLWVDQQLSEDLGLAFPNELLTFLAN